MCIYNTYIFIWDNLDRDGEERNDKGNSKISNWEKYAKNDNRKEEGGWYEEKEKKEKRENDQLL